MVLNADFSCLWCFLKDGFALLWLHNLQGKVNIGATRAAVPGRKKVPFMSTKYFPARTRGNGFV